MTSKPTDDKNANGNGESALVESAQDDLALQKSSAETAGSPDSDAPASTETESSTPTEPPTTLESDDLDADSAFPILAKNYAALPLIKPAAGLWRTRLLVLLFACAIFLPNLGSFGLWDPWETHYGEVTRDMVERNEWVSPFWGSRARVGGKRQGNYFYSKPIYIFWVEQVSFRVLGISEYSVRLPIALLAILAVLIGFWAFSTLYDRRTGWYAAVVLATCPMFFFIGRQAQTDMPFVASLTIALCFFIVALFKNRQEWTDKQFFIVTAAISAFFLLNTIPQWSLIAGNLKNIAIPKGAGLGGRLWRNGLSHFVAYSVIGAGVILSLAIPMWRHYRKNSGFTQEYKDRTIRIYYLFAFYIFCGHATMAKGLLGFMLPGAVIFFFLIASRRWELLTKAQLLRGIPLFFIVGWPWYIAMFVKHHPAFYNRFFVHDHFNRLGSGVHQIDTGNFEHFIKWLGFGMFPWVIFVPVLLATFAWIRKNKRNNYIRMFLFFWFFIAYTLFTLSSTKFHHYIFPALPGLAFLVALLLRHLEEMHGWRLQIALLTAIGMFGLLIRNLVEDPQHFRNLFTYQYSRAMATGDQLPIGEGWKDSIFFAKTNGVVKGLLNSSWLQFENFIYILAAIGGVGLLLFLVKKLRRYGIYSMMTVGVLLALWGLNYYMPMLSPHWSQQYLFDKYYSDCERVVPKPLVQRNFTPLVKKIPGLKWIYKATNSRGKQICKEKIIGWLLTWRGETFYSHNTLFKLDAAQLEPFIRDVYDCHWSSKEVYRGLPCKRWETKPRAFYVFGVKGGVNGLKSRLSRALTKVQNGIRRTRPNSALLRIKRFSVTTVFSESMFFELGVATPILK